MLLRWVHELTPQRLSLVTLGVSDVARSAAFYEAVGFERRHDLGEVVFLATAGPVLSLFGRTDLAADAGVPSDGSGFRGVTLACNRDSTAEVDETYAAWVAAGARAVKEPVAAEWGGYSGYVADPDGHLWEIAYNPGVDLMRIGEDGVLRLDLTRLATSGRPRRVRAGSPRLATRPGGRHTGSRRGRRRRATGHPGRHPRG